jgi:ApbE superfamily uncharacterized protein (UPF0280 family)
MEGYVERFYRGWTGARDLIPFEVKVRESDLLILAEQAMEQEAYDVLVAVRADIERYMARDPVFARTHTPHDVAGDAPDIVREMAEAAAKWDVGPMAAVAGAVAERVGRALAARSAAVIVENGGDVFALAPRPVRFALFAGHHSPFSGEIVFEVNASHGVGVCSSSGTVGPSFSYGLADAVTTIAGSAAEADAAATAVANTIREEPDVDRVIEDPGYRSRLVGLVVAKNGRLGVWGGLTLID